MGALGECAWCGLEGARLPYYDAEEDRSILVCMACHPDVDRLVKPDWGDPMLEGVPSPDDMEAWRTLFDEAFGPMDEE